MPSAYRGLASARNDQLAVHAKGSIVGMAVPWLYITRHALELDVTVANSVALLGKQVYRTVVGQIHKDGNLLVGQDFPKTNPADPIPVLVSENKREGTFR